MRTSLPANLRHRISGCVLGLALGDATGAEYEGGILERSLWRIIGTTSAGERRWTDDTQMSIDLIESFLERERVDPDDLAERFARNYRWSRGYGPGAARMLRRIRRGADWRQANRLVHRDGSWGNGAAMRAPIVGLIFSREPDQLPAAAQTQALVTHAHPLGMEGAVLIAVAVAEALRETDSLALLDTVAAHTTLDPFRTRLAIARDWLHTGEAPSAGEVRRRLGNGISATTSCVTAIYLALRFRADAFSRLLQFITSCGGDADTIGAMAGAIWGASNGFDKLPADLLEQLEQQSRLQELANRLADCLRA